MTDTKVLLQKIAALRARLDVGPITPPRVGSHDPLLAVEDQLQRGYQHNQLISAALGVTAGEDPTQPAAPPIRLTARGARLIRKGNEVLQSLRTIADDPIFQSIEEPDPLVHLHRDAVATVEVLLRTLQSFPTEVGAQLRMCDGLDVVLKDAEERVTLLCGNLAHRKHEIARINELAEFMTTLATNQPVRLAPLQTLADTIIAEANLESPLRFAYASPRDPARFAAAHGLTTAHVMARLLRDDASWKQQLQLAIMATLLHDIGMVRVPAEVLLTPGPLDNDGRRLVEKHTAVARVMLAPLWPGGGWPLEAAVQHHERADGTGYPVGMKHLEQSSFVRLLAVCDVYAAMCSPRPHRPALDTRAALTEILFLAERDFLDKYSAERLLALSFYPIGTTVELNDGSIAIVLATHAGQRGLTNPSRPIVHLVADAQGQMMPWPTVVDLLAQRDRGIVRSLNAEERQAWLGKKYPQLI